MNKQRNKSNKRKNSPMATIAFRIPKEDAKRIKRTAKRAKCTPSELLRTAWSEFTEKLDLREFIQTNK